MCDDISGQDRAIESKTQEIGRFIFDHLRVQRPNVLQRRWWDDRIMSWAMKDELLKVQLFRFIDVLPMLHTDQAVFDHLDEYLGELGARLPLVMRTALTLGRSSSLGRKTLVKAARLNAMDYARRFIAGTNAREVLSAALGERTSKRGFTLDILGEAVTSELEAERFFSAYVNLIEEIAPTVNAWPEVPQIDRGALGPLPRVNLSVKLSALDSQFDAIDQEGTTSRAGDRLRELLRVACRNEAFINVDMESYEKKDLTLRIFKEVLLEDEFRDVGDVGIVIQCYLRDAENDLVALRDWAAERGKPVWVRLVKGAYWDYETIHAKATGWPIPVYQEKWQSDANFEKQTRFLMKNYELLRPALASHNIRSLAHGIAVAQHLNLPDHGFEIQMLYGMADAAKQTLAAMGHRVRVYMPYGELIPGMAYLVRRLLENTSNDSFLRASLVEDASADQLLARPVGEKPNGLTSCSKTDQREEVTMTDERGSAFSTGFHNEPPSDFTKDFNRDTMSAALETVRAQFGKRYPLVIGDDRIDTDELLSSRNPSRKDQVVGQVGAATKEDVRSAVAAARHALPGWWQLGADRRAEFLRRAADGMRNRRFELAAWIVVECGKGWREADADVCEAIDFCEYYAAGAVSMFADNGADVPGEENRFEYIPRGVTAVIAPWNFPLAILTGMTVAALATGNTVVMKPAEQSSVVAAQLMEVFTHVNLPAGVLNYLPGPGEVAGAALVEHPNVACIAFTGSREVGLAINASAAQKGVSNLLPHEGDSAQKDSDTFLSPCVKRVIAEMGGKNAIIVDDDADLDEAVLGVVQSAFGYQGQKCSACSRAIVLNAAYDTFIERLIEATRSLKVGPAEDPSDWVGPVIDEESLAKVHRYIDLGRQEGREVLSVDVGALSEQGYFVGPHIFADIEPDARLAQEEVFGPVLAVIRVSDLDEAIRIANATDYGLTAGIYSRSPAHLDRARREIMVGNLYLNRSITGALVGRQPFGGFKLSGIGSKAGGPDYLLQFVLPRTITENTMRRGFAPST